MCAALQKEGKDYSGDIENLFRAEWYLFSPLTEPNRFLNKEYFLTAQRHGYQTSDFKENLPMRQTRIFSLAVVCLGPERDIRLLYDIAMNYPTTAGLYHSLWGSRKEIGNFT
ncbi:MAG: hypothetical protein ACLTDV_03000 [Eubacterium sp.]